MMTNPECVLVDNGEVKFTGTIEEAKVWLDGYAEAVLDIAWDSYLDEKAREQAMADWLSDYDRDDDFDFSFVSDEVSLGQVVDAASVDADEQDNAEAYADVVLRPDYWAYAD